MKWDWQNQSFWDWLKGAPPEPGDPAFIGALPAEDHLNVKGILNPFTSTKIDDYLILIVLLYGVYRFSK